MSCTTTLHVAVKTEHACRARHHYMHFTSPRFAVGIHIPQRRVVLEVGFSRPCGMAFTQVWFALSYPSREHDALFFDINSENSILKTPRVSPLSYLLSFLCIMDCLFVRLTNYAMTTLIVHYV